MWNWKSYPEEEVRSAKNPYITYYRHSDPKSLDHPSNYSMFDVKRQYTSIKENHPNYLQSQLPHQKTIKMTYLNQMSKNPSEPFQVVNTTYLGGLS